MPPGSDSLAALMSAEVPSAHPRWWFRHPALFALAGYVVLGVIFFGPGLLPGHTTSAADYLWNAPPWSSRVPGGVPVATHHPLLVGSSPQLVDAVTVFEPFLQYARALFPHVPLWDPYIMGGMPYLADMQSAIFSPFSIPAYFLPFWWSLSLIAVMKVVVAGMGTYLLARRLDLRHPGAFLAGVVYGFGLFVIAWIPWPLANVFPLIPWMLLATELIVRRPAVLTSAGLAVVMALQLFGGHPETSMQAVFITVAYFLIRLFQSAGGGAGAAMRAARDEQSSQARALTRVAARPVVAFVTAAIVGTGIAAVVILPFLELLRHSNDLAARPRSQVHVSPKFFFAAFLPTYFPGTFEIDTAFYVGALPLILGVFALFRATVARVFLAIGAVVSVLIVIGIQPLFFIAAHTPGLDYTYLSRFTILYLLCMALLAGFGLQDLTTLEWSRRTRIAGVAVALGIFALPLLVALAKDASHLDLLAKAARVAWPFTTVTAKTHRPSQPVVRLASGLVWLLIAGAAVVLVALRLGNRMRPPAFAILGILLVVADLFQAGMGYNPGIPESHAVQPVTPAIRFLQREGTNRFVGVTPLFHINPLPPDVSLRYGLYDLRGYDLPVISRFGNLWTKYVSPPNLLLPLNTPAVPLTISGTLPPDTLKVLSLYGVTDILEQTGQRPLTNPGLHLAYRGSDAVIYRNSNALPRAWLVSGEQVVPSASAELSRLVAPAFDPRTTLIAPTALPHLSTGARSPGGAGGAGSAKITSYQAEKVTIVADASRASELVLSDSWYPGWQVTVNGKPQSIERVDYLLRGVSVPAGRDVVVFTYEPASFRLGWIVSLAATLILVGAVGSELVRRRRRSSTSRMAAPTRESPAGTPEEPSSGRRPQPSSTGPD